MESPKVITIRRHNTYLCIVFYVIKITKTFKGLQGHTRPTKETPFENQQACSKSETAHLPDMNVSWVNSCRSSREAYIGIVVLEPRSSNIRGLKIQQACLYQKSSINITTCLQYMWMSWVSCQIKYPRENIYNKEFGPFR